MNAPASGAIVPWIDGNVPQRTSRNTWNLAIDGELPWRDAGGHSWARAELSHQDDVFDRSINGARYGRRTLLGARAGWTRGPWSLECWGRNLTDARYVRAMATRGPAFYPATPRPLDLIYGDARSVGLTLRFER